MADILIDYIYNERDNYVPVTKEDALFLSSRKTRLAVTSRLDANLIILIFLYFEEILVPYCMQKLYNFLMVNIKTTYLGKSVYKLRFIYFLRFIASGSMWLFYGVLGLFDKNNMTIKTVSTITMLLAVIFIAASLLLKKEPEDELSRTHLLEASTYTLSIIAVVIMVLSWFVSFIPETVFNFALIYPFIIASILLLVGFIWLYLERPLGNEEC